MLNSRVTEARARLVDAKSDRDDTFEKPVRKCKDNVPGTTLRKAYLKVYPIGLAAKQMYIPEWISVAPLMISLFRYMPFGKTAI